MGAVCSCRAKLLRYQVWQLEEVSLPTKLDPVALRQALQQRVARALGTTVNPTALIQWQLVQPSRTRYNATLKGLKQLGISHIDPGSSHHAPGVLRELIDTWISLQVALAVSPQLQKATVAVLIINGKSAEFAVEIDALLELGLKVVLVTNEVRVLDGRGEPLRTVAWSLLVQDATPLEGPHQKSDSAAHSVEGEQEEEVKVDVDVPDPQALHVDPRVGLRVRIPECSPQPKLDRWLLRAVRTRLNSAKSMVLLASELTAAYKRKTHITVSAELLTHAMFRLPGLEVTTKSAGRDVLFALTKGGAFSPECKSANLDEFDSPSTESTPSSSPTMSPLPQSSLEEDALDKMVQRAIAIRHLHELILEAEAPVLGSTLPKLYEDKYHCQLRSRLGAMKLVTVATLCEWQMEPSGSDFKYSVRLGSSRASAACRSPGTVLEHLVQALEASGPLLASQIPAAFQTKHGYNLKEAIKPNKLEKVLREIERIVPTAPPTATGHVRYSVEA